MNNGSRCGRAYRGEDLVRLPDLSLEGKGRVAQLRRQVPADEAVCAGDENRRYLPSAPGSLPSALFSRSASRCARMRFWSASFEITVE